MSRAFVIGVGMTRFDEARDEGGRLPGLGRRGGHEGARRRRHRLRRRSSRPTPATSTGTRPTGSAAVYGLGLTGIPVVNVNNNCSTGSSALFLARQAIRGGLADCALAIGFEKMERGSLGASTPIARTAMDRHVQRDDRAARPGGVAEAPQMFGNAGREHMERYGSKPEHFAWIGWKNHRHSVNNPYAQFQVEYSPRGDQGRADDPSTR